MAQSESYSPIVSARARLMGESEAMRKTLDMLDAVAPSEASVLILGESGTGKELAARAIHELSRRVNGPFIAFNCAAIPESLMEAELFGVRKGAFTGADRDRAGRLVQARGGTFFLDEVGDMPRALQAKLLRALQERVIEPLGTESSVPIDIRIVAATHQDIGIMAARGEFRADLYYRLNVVELTLPPLRDRSGDIAPLARSFLSRAATRDGREVLGFDEEALAIMEAYPWPGNVRELENIVERAYLLTKGSMIKASALPPRLKLGGEHDGSLRHWIRAAFAEIPSPDAATGAWRPVMARMERALAAEALDRAGGSRKKAAAWLGISRNTLKRVLDDDLQKADRKA